MIFIAGISIAFFIAALLLVKKDKSRADVILMSWMILNAVHLSLFYLTFTEEIYNYPHLLGLMFPFPLLHGVFLYYYVATVTNQQPEQKWIWVLHLIPTITVYLYLIPFTLLPAAEKIEVFKNEGRGYEEFLTVLLIAVIISGIAYVFWSSWILHKHKKRIRDQFSNLEDINLKWLQFLVYGLGAVWAIVIITQNDILIYMGVSLFVILVGFFGVQQKNIFGNSQKTAKEEDDPVPEARPPTKEKYQKSGLTEEKEADYYDRLNKLILEEKVYTDADLSLTDLATKLDINPNYLSQLINTKEGKTFYDYINFYRVEEFKRLIAIPKNQQFTLVAIAYDCGFNSKSSFNRYFKKLTGQTPSQYVKPLKA